ncbi:hypothetical protein FNF29_05319 [Cafeteria roenbergensis]|uniref:RING-type domain-containing protein n=1 Tax=Cafeteria roenbergensis TaxID=33653 RepID=A0A5A8CCE4_CAFRO|nr:hypothetical protein FNF29_05319 [Cafeteria roenbergensis]|eukprot:KAA0150307.1 hypothetical protein FNF29_05319 [Cafeteria roenbergensis]
MAGREFNGGPFGFGGMDPNNVPPFMRGQPRRATGSFGGGFSISVAPGGGVMFRTSGSSGQADAAARHHAAMMNMMMRSLGHGGMPGIAFAPGHPAMGHPGMGHTAATSDAQLEAIAARLFDASHAARTTGVSKASVDAIPVETFTADSVKDPGGAVLSCPVCQDDFAAGESACKLSCKHFFHKECLEPWLKDHNTCPTCREVIPETVTGAFADGDRAGAVAPPAPSAPAPSAAGAAGPEEEDDDDDDDWEVVALDEDDDDDDPSAAAQRRAAIRASVEEARRVDRALASRSSADSAAAGAAAPAGAVPCAPPPDAAGPDAAEAQRLYEEFLAWDPQDLRAMCRDNSIPLPEDPIPSVLESLPPPPSLAPGTEAPGGGFPVEVELTLPSGRTVTHLFSPVSHLTAIAALAVHHEPEAFDTHPDSRLPLLGLELRSDPAPPRAAMSSAGGRMWLAPWAQSFREAGISSVAVAAKRLDRHAFDSMNPLS